MIYTPLTAKAMNLVSQAHHGKVDKGGTPYVFHPYHLAEQMTDETSICVALLHDVLEDTSVTLDTLRAHFPDEITVPVQQLTRQKCVDYFDYIRAIRQNPVATKVKLADIAHNLDFTRLSARQDLSEDQLERLKEKYERAQRILRNE